MVRNIVRLLGWPFRSFWRWKLRRWFIATHEFAREYHEGVQLISVLLVAAVTAALAFQANRLTQSTRDVALNQTKLMQQQVDLQARQSLPDFGARSEIGEDEQTGAMTETLTLYNDGGMARNATVNVYTLLKFDWELEDQSQPSFVGEGVPVPYYLPPAVTEFDGQEQVFGSVGNFTHYMELATQIEQILQRDYGASGLDHYLEILINIEYTDYQGIDRNEWYIVDKQPDWPEKQDSTELIPWTSSAGQAFEAQFFAEVVDGFVLPLDPMPGSQFDIDEFARRIYEYYQNLFSEGMPSPVPPLDE